jgi:hypothetical protein
MAMTHRNLCEHAATSSELYQIWDGDLKRTMQRRQFYEAFGTFSLIASYLAWKHSVDAYYWAVALLIGIYCIIAALKNMVDESNINYLMHRWDLDSALAGFKGTQWP